MTRDEYFRRILSLASSRDAISCFARACWRLVALLLLFALAGILVWIAGFVFGFGFDLIGDWTLLILLPVLGYGLVHFWDVLTDRDFLRAIVFPAAAVLTGLVTVGCALYSLFLNPRTLLWFLGALIAYLGLVFVEGWLNTRLEPWPRLARRLIAAVLRSKREIALTAGIGFAIVLATQIDAIVWTAFNTEAIWAWERIFRPISSLPKPSLLFLLWALLSLAVLSALSPRHRFVERGLKAIRFYKAALALFITLASFTFLTETSIDSLYNHLLIEQSAAETTPEDFTITAPHLALTKAAWICYRLESATPEERNRIASELARLPEAERHGFTEWAARNMARELNGETRNSNDNTTWNTGQPAGSANNPTPPEPEADDPSRAQKVYAEARKAVTNVLSELIKDHTPSVHLDNDLLSSFASSLLASVLPALPDNVAPENLSDFTKLSERLKPLWPKQFHHSLTTLSLSPDWEDLHAKASAEMPPWGFTGVFSNAGKFSTDLFFETDDDEIFIGGEKPKPRLRIWEWVRIAARDAEEF